MIKASHSNIHNNVNKGEYLFIIFMGINSFVAGTKSTKGNPAKIQKQVSIEVNDDNSDKNSSVSSTNNSGGDKNGSDDEDGQKSEHEDEDVALMSDSEAMRMFNDEVFFFVLSLSRN